MVVHTTLTGAEYTDGQCIDSSGNIVTFYSDINNNGAYEAGVDSELTSIIMCSAG